MIWYTESSIRSIFTYEHNKSYLRETYFRPLQLVNGSMDILRLMKKSWASSSYLSLKTKFTAKYIISDVVELLTRLHTFKRTKIVCQGKKS